MKKSILAVIFAPLLLSANASAGTSSWTGNANLFLGQKKLDSGDWEPVDKQPEGGILVDFKKQDWPVSIAIDFLSSSDTSTFIDPGTGISIDGKGETSEFDLGVRKIFNESGSSIKPYIGGGIAFINGKVTASASGFDISADDSGTGLWINGGLYWTLNQSFNLGFDVRYSQADVTITGETVKAGGSHFGILLGYHW